MVQAVIPTTVTGLQGRPVASTPAPTNNQALTWNGSAWVPAGPFLTAAGAPYTVVNYADNSGFTVNQRAYASGTALSAGVYGLDRWKAGASGCTLTFTAAPASTVVTITAGTLQQVIEGAALFNSSYTLSWTGSATGRVNTGAYVASPITFTGAPNTNVTIEFQGGTLGQVMLQVGTQATLWQAQPAAVEMERCQRFYEIGSAYFGDSTSAGAGIWQTIFFNTPKRTTPTLGITGIGGISSNITAVNPANPAAGSAISTMLVNFSIPATGNWLAAFVYTASADL